MKYESKETDGMVLRTAWWRWWYPSLWLTWRNQLGSWPQNCLSLCCFWTTHIMSSFF